MNKCLQLTVTLLSFTGFFFAAQVHADGHLKGPNCEGVIIPQITGCRPSGPDKTWPVVAEEGVDVVTFVQEYKGKSYTRRYLQNLPENFDANRTYPLVVVLHGATTNAEIARQFDTQRSLDSLVDSGQFILVYANALPETYDSNIDPLFSSGSQWAGATDPKEISDERLELDLDYLSQIAKNLALDGIKTNKKKTFALGISNGGYMALAAIDKRPELFRAIYSAIPVPYEIQSKRLQSSVMISYSQNDPVVPNVLGIAPQMYNAKIENIISSLAQSLKVKDKNNVLVDAAYSALPNTVKEGENYSGDSAVAKATINSTLEEFKTESKNGKYALHIIRSSNAGHGIPHPIQLDDGTVQSSTGFRNQDIDSVAMAWEFFKQYTE